MPNKEELIKEFSEAEERKHSSSEQPQAVDEATSAEKEKSHKSKKHSHKRHRFFKQLRSMLADKTLNKMLNVFLLCMIVNCVEYFVLINYFGIPTRGAVGKVLGTLIIIGYMYTARLKPQNVGLKPDRRAVFSGIRNAVIFNLAIIPAYLIELLYLTFVRGSKPILRVFAYSNNLSSENAGVVPWLAYIVLLVAINALAAVMLEVLFRGILMKMGKAKFGFKQTTVIVSVFYSIWYLIIPLSKIAGGIKNVLTLCLFYLIFEFVMSVKWCLCTRASGTVWLAVFDHFIFTTAVGLIRVVETVQGTNSGIDSLKYYRFIIIQVVSLIICWAYYKKKMHKKEQMLQAAGVRSIYSFDSLADMSEEDVSLQADRIKTADGEIDAEYLKHLNKLSQEEHYR